MLFAGGDQANYVRWKNTALIRAVRHVYERGGVVGGGSAGLAIQGAVVFDSVSDDKLSPNGADVATRDALADPLERMISFTTNFFSWPPLRDAITDTHFARRDRFGRLVAFMERALAEHLVAGARIYGVAVDEGSVLLVDGQGRATLYSKRESDGYQSLGAWILTARALRLRPGRPLHATVDVVHLSGSGARFDLETKTGAGTRYCVTVNGAARPMYSRNPYTGASR